VGFVSWTVGQIDLSLGPSAVDARGAGQLLYFQWGSMPLGRVALCAAELPMTEAQVRDIAEDLIARQWLARRGGPAAYPRAGVDGVPRADLSLGEAAEATGMVDFLDRLAGEPTRSTEGLSVVICTRDRPDLLQRCLEALAAQISPPAEIVVVDNAAAGTARAVCQAHEAVTWVHEPRPGLSRARNAGVRAARGHLLAFTDDDVTVAANWTSEIVRAFDDPRVSAVTGLVRPTRLETAAQIAFEFDIGGFTSGDAPVVFDRSFLELTRSMGPQVWRIGAGANMAFRRTLFAQVGGFDERLGAGAAGCSEDSEFWYRVLSAGGLCLYEPRAVTFHDHRLDLPSLRHQLRAYMRGHVAALVAQGDRYGDRGNFRRIHRQLPAYFIRTAAASVQNLTWRRLDLLLAEFTGWLLGLQYLVRWRWRSQGAQYAPAARTAERQALGHA
jgi:GT2 family glycosyltransferase